MAPGSHDGDVAACFFGSLDDHIHGIFAYHPHIDQLEGLLFKLCGCLPINGLQCLLDVSALIMLFSPIDGTRSGAQCFKKTATAAAAVATTTAIAIWRRVRALLGLVQAKLKRPDIDLRRS